MTQIDIEEKFNKANITKWCLEEIHGSVMTDNMFLKAVDNIANYIEKRDTYYNSKAARVAKLQDVDVFDIAVELFKIILLQQETTVAHISTTIGKKFYTDTMDAVKMGAEVLGVCSSIGLYDITVGSRQPDGDVPSFVTSNYSFDEVTQQKIHTAMYLPPMLETPREWTDNRNGGLLLSNRSAILGEGNDVGQNQALDVLNTLQDIRWEFNYAMLEMPELMSKGHDDAKKVKQHNDRMLHSKSVYAMLEGYDFNFIWNYDKRGRSYSQGYDVNLQGSDYKKAIIQFADKEIVQC